LFFVLFESGTFSSASCRSILPTLILQTGIVKLSPPVWLFLF
jgi:hypothetical protein